MLLKERWTRLIKSLKTAIYYVLVIVTGGLIVFIWEGPDDEDTE